MIASSIILFGYFLVFFMPVSVPSFVTRKKQGLSPFGLPQKWKTDCLPTRKDVGSYFLLKQREMKALMGKIPRNQDVAIEVYGV